MSALARLAELDGARVSGSDANHPPGHRCENIHSGIDLVIINGAIADDNPELLRARELGIEIMGRETLLAHIERRYTNRIAVAGSHGKSTTTAMIGQVLSFGGLNPTVHNGAHPNLMIGGRDYFVTEACEFKRSFLELAPTVAVITNVDFDHVDCYRDFDDIKAAFDTFGSRAQTVFWGSEIDSAQLMNGIKLKVPGKHNIENAALAVTVGKHFGIPRDTIKAALENFTGIRRRFEKVGAINDCIIIDDYAHHPTEIAATIETAESIYGANRFLVVFQPHTFTRTKALFHDFVHSLGRANCVLYKTFSAREKPIQGGTAHDLARALGCRYFASPEALKRYLGRVAAKYDAIIMMGAGDLDKIF